MMKLSMGCIHLEILDLNGVTQIKDESIKIIAHYCKKLKIIRLKQCFQLSDVSILAISSNNTNLQELDVSRTQLGYKITDVSLLSLAERCPGLHKLDLSGCDAISDVGISWLSSGCHALLNLNLNGCRLLT